MFLYAPMNIVFHHTCDVFAEMTSSGVKSTIPPKPAPRRLTSNSAPDGAAVVTGNGNASSHDVTSSASSSTDEQIQLVAELPDERRVILFVDARYILIVVAHLLWQ